MHARRSCEPCDGAHTNGDDISEFKIICTMTQEFAFRLPVFVYGERNKIIWSNIVRSQRLN